MGDEKNPLMIGILSALQAIFGAVAIYLGENGDSTCAGGPKLSPSAWLTIVGSLTVVSAVLTFIHFLVCMMENREISQTEGFCCIVFPIVCMIFIMTVLLVFTLWGIDVFGVNNPKCVNEGAAIGVYGIIMMVASPLMSFFTAQFVFA